MIAGYSRYYEPYLLTNSELNLFKRVWINRKNGTGNTLIANQAGLPYQANELSQMISQLIKETTGLAYLTTHHLRHSCLSNLQLMSYLYDPAYNFAQHPAYHALKDLLPYYDKQANKILKHFETPIHYKRIYALAGIAGHASPSTTFASYVHLTDIQLGLLIWHIDFKLTAEHSNILDIPRRRISEIETAPQEINQYLLKKLKLPHLAKPKIAKQLSKQSIKPQTKKFSFTEVRHVLDTYQNKQDYQELLQVYEIDQQTFDTWLANAKHLKEHPNFITKRGKSRLFAPDDNRALLPTLDRFADDRQMMMQMTDKFRTLYQDKRKRKNKQLLNHFVIYTLTHCQYHRNYISFSDTSQFADYMQILTQLVFKKDIQLTVYNINVAPRNETKSWQKILDKFQVTQVKNQVKKRSVDLNKSSYQKHI